MIDSDFFFQDAFDLFAGEMLGEGMSRRVFAHKRDESLVIKIERGHQSFQNIREWDMWMELGYTKPFNKWLAPCVAISPRGHALIQRRVMPVTKEELPDKIPAFLADTKVRNFGRYKGRIVCCDYANNVPNPSARLKKVKWRGEWGS